MRCRYRCGIRTQLSDEEGMTFGTSQPSACETRRLQTRVSKSLEYFFFSLILHILKNTEGDVWHDRVNRIHSHRELTFLITPRRKQTDSASSRRPLLLLLFCKGCVCVCVCVGGSAVCLWDPREMNRERVCVFVSRCSWWRSTRGRSSGTGAWVSKEKEEGEPDRGFPGSCWRPLQH